MEDDASRILKKKRTWSGREESKELVQSSFDAIQAEMCELEPLILSGSPPQAELFDGFPRGLYLASKDVPNTVLEERLHEAVLKGTNDAETSLSKDHAYAQYEVPLVDKVYVNYSEAKNSFSLTTLTHPNYPLLCFTLKASAEKLLLKRLMRKHIQVVEDYLPQARFAAPLAFAPPALAVDTQETQAD